MNKKQTAVQFVHEKMYMRRLSLHQFEKLFEQALQMERDQHKQTWLDSTKQFANDANLDNPIEFETYYTKTFKP
jgi:hypothetical protein